MSGTEVAVEVTLLPPEHNEVAAIARDFAAGTCSGITSKIMEYPFDTVKVRQQTEPGLRTLECLKATYTHEGVKGFYKGLTVPLAGATAEMAIVFVLYAKTLRALESRRKKQGTMPKPTSIVDHCGAGVVAGAGVSFLLTPLEGVKVQLQSRHTASNYTGPTDCIRKMYAQGGMRTFFKGHSFTMLRESIGGALFFGGYNVCLQALKPGKTKEEVHPLVVMAAGGVGGACYWTGIFPFDTVKSQVQSGVVRADLGVLGTARQVFRSHGFQGLYNGVGATVARAIPATAVVFGTYEGVLRLLS